MDGIASDPTRYDGYFAERATAEPARNFDLSPCELANLRWIAHGLNGKDVARERFVSFDTVQTQLASARRKLAAKTTAHAVAIAIRNHLIL